MLKLAECYREIQEYYNQGILKYQENLYLEKEWNRWYCSTPNVALHVGKLAEHACILTGEKYVKKEGPGLGHVSIRRVCD